MTTEQKYRENILNYIIRFLTKLGYFEIANDPKKMNEFIQKLTLDQFKNLLVTFNAMLRNMPTREKTTFNDRNDKVYVGEKIAPSIDVREKILPELLEGLKQLESNEERAILLYYSLLDLHMFEDGNGRTARFFYNLINGNINLRDEIDWYIHDKRNYGTYKSTFENEKGLMDIEDFDYLVSNFLPRALIKYPPVIEMIKSKLLLRYRICTSNFYSGSVPIPKIVQEQLTEEELINIETLILDNIGKYTVGGLTMLIMSTKKGQLQDWIDIAKESNKFTDKSFEFDVVGHPELFESWTIEDYREAIRIGDELKYLQLINLIKIFTKPENYSLNNGIPIVSKILPQTKKIPSSSKK